MDEGRVAAFIFAAVAVAMIGQGWMSLLEHQRRKQAMDVIKAVLQAGKEAPPIIYEQLRSAGRSKPPWSEVVVFTALGFGFWIAYANAEGDQRISFLVVAAIMTITALGCLGLAIMRPGEPKDRNDAE